MSKTLTFNRFLKVMSVDLARPAMACKLANWRGADRGMSWPGLIEGGSLLGGDVPRFLWWGVRRLRLGYTYPVGGALVPPSAPSAHWERRGTSAAFQAG